MKILSPMHRVILAALAVSIFTANMQIHAMERPRQPQQDTHELVRRAKLALATLLEKAQFPASKIAGFTPFIASFIPMLAASSTLAQTSLSFSQAIFSDDLVEGFMMQFLTSYTTSLFALYISNQVICPQIEVLVDSFMDRIHHNIEVPFIIPEIAQNALSHIGTALHDSLFASTDRARGTRIALSTAIFFLTAHLIIFLNMLDSTQQNPAFPHSSDEQKFFDNLIDGWKAMGNPDNPVSFFAHHCATMSLATGTMCSAVYTTVESLFSSTILALRESAARFVGRQNVAWETNIRCPTCLNDFENDADITILQPCQHAFCNDCATQPGLKLATGCPVCRTPVTEMEHALFAAAEHEHVD